MKIAIIGQKGIPAFSGGVEKHVENLSVHLANLGHDVTVYTRSRYSKTKLKTYMGVNLINLPSIPTKHLDAISHTFFSVLDAIFRRDYDIIHFHSIGPSSLIWLVKLFKPRIPVVATFHTQCYHHKKWGNLAKYYLKFGEFVCCHSADKVITVSETLKKYADKKYQITTVYIPNGVNIPQLASAQIISQRWSLLKNSYIVVITRLIAHKGVQYVINAYNDIKTDKKLVIVGSGHFTDKYASDLRKLAENNQNIIFTGNQSGATLAELFSNAFFFIQPSESEGLSIALLEAISFGRAVLVSDIPENLEPIGDFGFVFKNKNVADLKNKMKYLLDNPDLAEQRGKLGREFVLNKYNWQNISREIINLYQEAIREKNQ